MARKRNDNRFRGPATCANNRRGPRSVNFDDDYPMGGVHSPTVKGRHPPDNRRSQNNYNPLRGRGRSPYRSNNRKNNHAPSFSQGQYSRNNHNSYHDTQGHRTNSRNNSSVNQNNKHNRQRHPRAASTDNADTDFDENTSIDDAFNNSSFFSPRQHTHNGVHKGKSSNNNMRFCTECSSVRRANLRFRNWAVHALNRCNERFAAWADEVGVEFGTADEMDWQPEPVVRVLLVGGDMSSTSTSTASATSLPPINQFTSKAGQQQQEEQIGPIPTPGPWAWPPWSAPTACPALEAPPAQPQDGGPAMSQGNILCEGIRVGDGNGNLPISGFGLLGVSCGGEASGPSSNPNLNAGLNQWSIRDQSSFGEVGDD
ncbi:hypothetical protein F5Y00DRAFT_273141 [Daldinia vernicosa]|uniref:uncharacterized protein n=1 Tax=Daldinia vernicosa TaxID=114800 RepID=UPI0020077422|nr:uncharacterized protein F5Y00DRAFT_273141 [Daldinia vernicosa]KAI0852549.1 hypothetical protein F5Y00DRAFT_273141 [Daldinia vernicosa]